MPTVEQHLEAWLKRGMSRARQPWAAITLHGYQSMARTWLVPHLGHIPLDKLTVDDVEEMLEQVPGAKHAKNIRAALSAALTMAVKARVIPTNVAALADSPRVESTRGNPLSPDEVLLFYEHVRAHRLGPVCIVSMVLALRPSEAFGLRWQDVDLDARRLKIQRKIYFLGGRYHEGAPKSPRSRRQIMLPQKIVDVLQQQRERVEVERLITTGWEDQDLVFPNEHGGPLYGSYVTRTMQRLLGEIGIERRRFYDLRHTGASLLHALGVDIRTIQEVLGHSDVRITANTYTHVDESLQEDAALRMGAFLVGGNATP